MMPTLSSLVSPGVGYSVPINFIHNFQGHITGVREIENPSWAPVLHRVCIPEEYNLMRVNSIPQGAMIDPISSTMFLPVITSQKHWKSLSNHRKSQSEARNHSWVWKNIGDCFSTSKAIMKNMGQSITQIP